MQFNEIIDWIEYGESGCMGLFYTLPDSATYPKKGEKMRIVFQCPTTAMLVKVRWG